MNRQTRNVLLRIGGALLAAGLVILCLYGLVVLCAFVLFAGVMSSAGSNK